ncbi:MAG: hypothetical protein WCF16_03415 [Alphaproteobacteria bacterium]
MATNLTHELTEQRRWRLRPAWEKLGVFEALVRNEFASRERQTEWERRALQVMIRYAFAGVPYYRRLAGELGLKAADIAARDDLARLPLLTKRAVFEHASDLQAPTLPKGELRIGYTQSSGTTGRPTRVDQTAASNGMFNILKQREYRWFRFDPDATLGSIRLASQLPMRPDGKPYDDGETCRMDTWPNVGEFFFTGPFVAFNVTNPVESHVAWLQRERPRYFVSYSESLEHLALAWGDAPPWEGLSALLAISEQLTESMRRRIAKTFDVPIHQNYGLNEIGLVATRCEAGRYHVHNEHCLVEIVADDGRAVPPGGKGRIVVTSLQNRLMPLIRYDTDDVAEALEGPCPCGRSLPAFGAISGRYSRIAFLPPRTLGLVGAVRAALEDMPVELSKDLRQFQMYQSKDDRFELRLVAANPLPPAFAARIREVWDKAAGASALPLAIKEVDRIARSPGGKYQDFVSEFFPAPDEDGGSGGATEPA